METESFETGPQKLVCVGDKSLTNGSNRGLLWLTMCQIVQRVAF